VKLAVKILHSTKEVCEKTQHEDFDQRYTLFFQTRL